jgi:hypothetical protein
VTTLITLAVVPMFLALPAGHPVEAARVGTSSALGDIADSARYVRARPAIAAVVYATVAVVMISFPYLAFLPSVSEDEFDRGATGLGFLSAAAGAGAVLGGLASRAKLFRAGAKRALEVSGSLLGVALIALAVAPTYWLAGAALLLVGAAGLLFQTTSQSMLLLLSDVEYHGRMQSMVILGFSGFGVAALPLGVLADATSLRFALGLMGATAVAIVLVYVAWSRTHPLQPVPHSARSSPGGPHDIGHR